MVTWIFLFYTHYSETFVAYLHTAMAGEMIQTLQTDLSLPTLRESVLPENQCVHSSSPVLSNADFNTIWSTVRSAVVDLDSLLNNGNQFEQEVDFLRQETMDPVRDRHYIEELRKQAEEDAETRQMVQGLKQKVEESETERNENHNKMLKIV
ncbi:uncharacterized protein LOC134282811, partial [Saccostrea cucullata]|uniref:uncharacterized protein LOC134282811 n=1 Tax=Saccostrea cuccullata TaxID=36930 RepID=UPI002ED3F1A1